LAAKINASFCNPLAQKQGGQTVADKEQTNTTQPAAENKTQETQQTQKKPLVADPKGAVEFNVMKYGEHRAPERLIRGHHKER